MVEAGPSPLTTAFDLAALPLFRRVFGQAGQRLLFHRYFRAVALPGRRATVVVSFDCDHSDDVRALPQALNILDNLGLPAAFACVGQWIERFPDEHREIVRRGHEIFNHSYSHPNSSELNPRPFPSLSGREMLAEITRCDRAAQEILNVRPVGFRTPHFGTQHRYRVYSALRAAGYTYSSSLIRFPGCPNGPLIEQATGVLEFPMASVPGLPAASFDTWNYFRGSKQLAASGRDFARDFETLVDGVTQEGGFLTFYLDPRDLVNLPACREALHVLSQATRALSLTTYAALAAGNASSTTVRSPVGQG